MVNEEQKERLMKGVNAYELPITEENQEWAEKKIKSCLESKTNKGEEVLFLNLSKDNAEYFISRGIFDKLGYKVISQKDVPYGVRLEVERIPS